MKGFRLSEEQKIAFEFLMEFFDANRNRGHGRTYVMACVIIAMAHRNPGVPIELYDHDMLFPIRGRQRAKFLVGKVRGIISQMPDDMQDDFEYNRAENTLCYKPKGQTNQRVIADDEKLYNLIK